MKNNNFNNYIKSFKDYYIPDSVINAIILNVNLSKTILYLNVNLGNDYSLLTKDYNVIGCDIYDEHLLYLNLKFNKKFLKNDLIQLDLKNKVDAIFSYNTLNNLNEDDFITSIKKQHALLNDNGCCIHTFSKFDTVQGIEFSNQHNKEFIEKVSKIYSSLTFIDYKDNSNGDCFLVILNK